MSPVTTIVIAIDVMTEELCTMAVNAAPMRTSRKGFSKKARKFFTDSSSEK